MCVVCSGMMCALGELVDSNRCEICVIIRNEGFYIVSVTNELYCTLYAHLAEGIAASSICFP